MMTANFAFLSLDIYFPSNEAGLVLFRGGLEGRRRQAAAVRAGQSAGAGRAQMVRHPSVVSPRLVSTSTLLLCALASQCLCDCGWPARVLGIRHVPLQSLLPPTRLSSARSTGLTPSTSARPRPSSPPAGLPRSKRCGCGPLSHRRRSLVCAAPAALARTAGGSLACGASGAREPPSHLTNNA